MKETAIVAPVFECSGCKYWSLHKTHTSNHISKKCPEAQIVSKKKIVKHQDPNNERDDITTLYQCSKCSYTSYSSSPVNTHIKKCPGAELIKEQRKLFLEDVPADPVGTINNNTNVGIGINYGTANQNIINIVMPAVNSKEEFEERLDILFKVAQKHNLSFTPEQFKPSVLIKGFETESPGLNNKKYTNNSIVCLKTGERTPVGQYADQEQASIYELWLAEISRFSSDNDNNEQYMKQIWEMVERCIAYSTISVAKRNLDKIAELVRNDPDRKNVRMYSKEYYIAKEALSSSLTDIKNDQMQQIRKDIRGIDYRAKSREAIVNNFPDSSEMLNTSTKQYPSRSMFKISDRKKIAVVDKETANAIEGHRKFNEDIIQQYKPSTNIVVNFLESDAIVLDQNKICPISKFKIDFKEYACANNIHPNKLSDDIFDGPFAQYNIKKLGYQTLVYNGKELSTEFISGCDLANNDSNVL